ncbi:hypothetical protein FLACOL_00610 [Flavobacterium columnare]|uniref:Prepilin type IV endopeptidase peptidase domain-containing protein n=1 Tax=Flavobacterium columnare TaxID=996 RepID=A0A2N9P8G3_9FLAO|nr:hypothetical protein FLACOL_00610 [Flavobacterium columnare]
MFLQVVLLSILGFIFYQDLKYRALHILLPILILIVGSLLLHFPLNLILKNALVNICFFLFIFGAMVLYMRIRHKNFANPLQAYFGLGDVLFFVSITPLFELKKYLVFLITSMLFAIILYFLFLKKKEIKSIPLAGFSSILLGFILIVKNFLEPFFLLLC